MQDVGRVAALALAGLLAWAAVAKLRRRRPTAESFLALGLPQPRALALAVPLVEAAVAAGLVLRPRVGAWPALALLVAFSAVIVRALAAGAGVPCACFGSTTERPVSARELVRNAVLAAFAVLATGAGPGWALSPLF
ncbi:MAG: methylamine utilization protein MauE [Actinobacteria bacterium]|nr:methylamine utilization protein MauE [Actinomycetota bacterium]